MIIAIDGPSGAGKSTIGKSLARELGFLYIDTGAMYRAVGLACLEIGADLSDTEVITNVSNRAVIDLAGPPDALRVLLNGRDVSQLIRAEEVSRAASLVSTVSAVRRRLVERQREMGARGNVVMDGRDIGTVVFPHADLKFFLTAAPESRAKRRYDEDLQKGRAVTYEATLADLIERDTRDTTRADSPLKQTAESIVIDSSDLAIDEVLAVMLRAVRRLDV